MGLDIYLEGTGIDKEMKSKMFPEHYWTPVYLRSNYNDRGFNSVVGNLTGKDLYWIFEPPEGFNTDHFVPNFDRVFERAQESLLSLQEAPKLRVISINMLSKVSASEAMKITHDQTNEVMFKLDEAWSSKEGFFSKGGIKVHGILFGESVFKVPEVYIVVGEDLKWYIKALQILINEFIPLARANADTAYLVWNG